MFVPPADRIGVAQPLKRRVRHPLHEGVRVGDVGVGRPQIDERCRHGLMLVRPSASAACQPALAGTARFRHGLQQSGRSRHRRCLGDGRGTARRLAMAGAAVVIVDRNADLAAAVAAGTGGGNPLVGDISDSAFCDGVVAEAVAATDSRRLVNAAGSSCGPEASRPADEQWAPDHARQRRRHVLHVPSCAPGR